MNNNGIKLNIKEPIVPETVLFGLILVNFFPPINLPITYPPISEKKHTDIINRKKTTKPKIKRNCFWF